MTEPCPLGWRDARCGRFGPCGCEPSNDWNQTPLPDGVIRMTKPHRINPLTGKPYPADMPDEEIETYHESRQVVAHARDERPFDPTVGDEWTAEQVRFLQILSARCYRAELLIRKAEELVAELDAEATSNSDPAFGADDWAFAYGIAQRDAAKRIRAIIGKSA